MISSRARNGILFLRLHHMFIDANKTVLVALANFLLGRRKGNDCLDRFIRNNKNKVRKKRRFIVNTRSSRLDLVKIRDAISRFYFKEPVNVPIVWGTWRKHRRQRSIRLGSYSYDERVVRIHPVLDQDFVPSYVVVGVVYHEMLHHVLGVKTKGGSRRVHTKEFKERERAFVHFEKANKWEKKNLSRLLNSIKK
jgi:hypothetical protein